VRDELEVRVAQLGAATGEVEQRAAELEAKLQDANAGGDAVRAETAALTAALAAANARTQELESAPADMGDRDADQAEISRLRGELAKHMERAQVAEDRISTLEADVLAAARGVQALEAHAATPAAKAPKPSGIEERAEPEPESAPTRDHQPEPARDVSSEPASAAVPPAPSSAARYDDMWTPAPAAPAEANAEPVEASTVGAAPRGPAEQPTSTASEATTSSDAGHDETAEPEDELSPDDMWSLRARLADAAARKRRHIE
jgi:hypothetical protein